MIWVYDDGGRAASGREGEADDDVARSLAISTNTPYDTVYRAVAEMYRNSGGPRTARQRIPARIWKPWLNEWFGWTPLVTVGSGIHVHVADGELPATGRYILRLSSHLSSLIDGKIRDAWDPGRDGTRAVYGWWRVDPTVDWEAVFELATTLFQRSEKVKPPRPKK